MSKTVCQGRERERESFIVKVFHSIPATRPLASLHINSKRPNEKRREKFSPPFSFMKQERDDRILVDFTSFFFTSYENYRRKNRRIPIYQFDHLEQILVFLSCV